MPLIQTGGGASFPDSVPATVGMFRDIGGELYWNGHKVDLRAGEPERELHRVTAAEITAKRATITALMDATRPTSLTLISVQGGSFPQVEGVDYVIIGASNQVSWDGYGMDGLVAEGDEIAIAFFERA